MLNASYLALDFNAALETWRISSEAGKPFCWVIVSSPISQQQTYTPDSLGELLAKVTTQNQYFYLNSCQIQMWWTA